jgi:hypothetical protein
MFFQGGCAVKWPIWGKFSETHFPGARHREKPHVPGGTMPGRKWQLLARVKMRELYEK